MTDKPPCQSYRERETICGDGFIQRPYCSGNVGCFHCGAIGNRYLPACLTDDIPAHMARVDGSPLYYHYDPKGH